MNLFAQGLSIGVLYGLGGMLMALVVIVAQAWRREHGRSRITKPEMVGLIVLWPATVAIIVIVLLWWVWQGAPDV